MSQLEVIYDSSKGPSHQFYNSLTKQFISSSEAQRLSDEGTGKIVIGYVPPPPSVILYDPTSNYWECYYNTETDRFLCESDARTLAETGLGQIVDGKIPYVIIKENGVYFDVVKDKRIGEDTALQLLASGKAVLKDKDNAGLTKKDKTDTCDSVTKDKVGSVKPEMNDKADSAESTDNFKDASESLPPSSQYPSTSSTSRHLESPPSSLGQKTLSSSLKEDKKEESLFEKVAPIAAGVAVAGVAIAGVAAAMFFGSGKKGKNKK